MRSAKDPMAIFSRSLPKATADSAGDAATIRDLATGTTKTIAEQRRSRPPLFAPSRRPAVASSTRTSADDALCVRMAGTITRAGEALVDWFDGIHRTLVAKVRTAGSGTGSSAR